jgi:hypothetical protein
MALHVNLVTNALAEGKHFALQQLKQPRREELEVLDTWLLRRAWCLCSMTVESSHEVVPEAKLT